MILASATAPLFGLVMLAIGGVVLAVSVRYVWRAGAVVRATEVASLADVTPGTLVRVTGTAQQGDAAFLTAPFSGRDCLALRYGVEERRLSPVVLPWFVTIHEAAGADEFRVRTAESTVDVVEPAHTVVLDDEVVASVGPRADPPDRIAQFEAGATGVPRSTVWRDPPTAVRPIARALSLGTRRYVEQRALPGDEVTVVGPVTADGAGIDPRVVSNASPATTVLRMARTSVVGLAVGAFAALVGAGMVLV